MPDIGSPRPPRPPLPEFFAPLSQGPAPTLPPPAALKPRARLPLGRAWRLVVAVGLVLAALLALWRQMALFTTQHAVLSAPMLTLRAPIAGELTWLAGGPGARLSAGAPVALLQHGEVDAVRRLSLEGQAARLAAEARAIQQQREALRGVDAALARRGQEQREEAARLYALRLDEAQALQSAAEARAQRLRAELRRGEELARGGHLAVQGRERLEAERLIAEREAEAMALRAEALRLQQAAALRGVWLAEGQGGISYTEQRRDEIALRDAELARQHATVTAEWTAASAKVIEERARGLRASEAWLTTPSALAIWRLTAEAGQRLRLEEPVADLVDCRASVLLVAVPQSEVPSLAEGGTVRFRLAGELRERTGTVRQWLPEGMAREGGRLALLPSRPPGASRLLEVALPEPEPDGACLVGRTARVVIPRAGWLGGLWW